VLTKTNDKSLLFPIIEDKRDLVESVEKQSPEESVENGSDSVASKPFSQDFDKTIETSTSLVDKDESPATPKAEFKNLNFRLNVFKKPSTTLVTNAQPSSNITTKPEDKRKPSALDEVMKSKEVQREKQNRKDHWLHKVFGK
jgi:hypothetical protein